MTEENISTTAKKSIITLTIEKLWPILLSIGLSAPAYLYSTSMEIASYPEYKKYSLILLAVLLCTAVLFLILWVRLYSQFGRYNFSFGVLWDKKLNMRCLYCHRLLKHSSTDPHLFFCSAPKCNNKHVLKDDNGIFLTKQEAINRLRK